MAKPTKFLNDAASNLESYALLDAAASGKLSEVRKLLDQGVNIDARDDRDPRCGVTPLMCATENGHTAVVKELIKRGATVNLKDRGFFGDGGGWTALHYAANSRHLSILKLLIKAGANVNAVANGSTGTALMIAVSKGDRSLTNALLKSGANLNIGDKDIGTTPLAIAGEQGHASILELLIKKGANVNTTDEVGDTPLTIAIRRGKFDTAHELLKSGANANLVGARGFTPLMCAVMSGYDTLVKRLLSVGVNLNARNQDGRTALDIALREGKREISELLKRAGALEGADAVDSQEEYLQVPIPDFKRKADSAEFKSAVASLEQLTDTTAHPLFKGYQGGVSFLLPKDQIRQILAQEHEEYLQNGFYLFECLYEKRLGLLPTTDKYEVIAVMQTTAPNDDKGPGEIIEWLRQLEKEQPFSLTGIGTDFLSGKFLTPIKNSRQLAEKIYDFCPDIFEGIDIATGALQLKNKGELFLWWD